MSNQGLSLKTRMNWLIDASVFLGGVLAAITGIYFLFLPSGGYRGGRNPMYGITILFDRSTWDGLHTWTGILMIAGVVIHLAIHWRWVVMMTKRIVSALTSRGSRLSTGAVFNVIVDIAIGISFFVTAVSGLYFLFAPTTGRGMEGRIPFIFDGTTWDLIHTWAFVVLVGAALVHFAIHWRWIVNVTGKFFGSFGQTRVIVVNVKAQA